MARGGLPLTQLKALLEDVDSNPHESEHITAVTQLWCEIFGNEPVCQSTLLQLRSCGAKSLVMNLSGLILLSALLALLFCGWL